MITREKLTYLLIAIVVICTMAVIAWINFKSQPVEQLYKHITVMSDGSLVKESTPLSDRSRALLPNPTMAQFIFGTGAEVLEGEIVENAERDGQEGEEFRTLFSVQDGPVDIFEEYKEYFEATRWEIVSIQEEISPYSLVVKIYAEQVALSVTPRDSGSTVYVVHFRAF